VHLQAAKLLSKTAPTLCDCGSHKPAVDCEELLKGFEHDLGKSPDIQELLANAKRPSNNIVQAVLKQYEQEKYVKFSLPHGFSQHTISTAYG